MTEKYKKIEEEVFNTAVYLLSSAKSISIEPHYYSLKRLFVAFKKVANLSCYFKGSENEVFWSKIRDRIKISKEDDFKEVNDLLSMFLNEAMKQAKQS